MLKKLKKSVTIFIISCLVLGINGCQQNQEKIIEEKDLSKEPIIGTWYVSSISATGGNTLKIAEMLEQNQVSDVTYYIINSDGTFTSKGTFQFGSTGESTWTKENDDYYFEAAENIKINYTDSVLNFSVDGNKIELTRGEKTAEELLKEAGLWHVDELTILSSNISYLDDQFYTVTYEIKNNTNESISFGGISLTEYDINNTILKDYYSYNKNAIDAELQAGQSVQLELTFLSADGISKIESLEYQYINKNGKRITGKFSSPYSVAITN